jgi:hypothetical protein
MLRIKVRFFRGNSWVSLFAVAAAVAGALALGACGDDDGDTNDNNGPDGGAPDAGYDLQSTACPGDPDCPDDGDGTFYAGAAVVDITPDLKEGPTFIDNDGNSEYNKNVDEYTDDNGNGKFDAVWIAGFGSSRPAVDVHDPIEARIIAMRHNETTVVMVSADLVGFFYDHLLGVRALLDAAVSDQVDLVVWSSTHNHEGPDMIGIWGKTLLESGLDEEYLHEVQQLVADGIGEAVDALEPAQVVHSAIEVEDSTGYMKHLFADGRDPVIINNTMNVLRFYRPADDSTIATVVNLGTHPEVLWDDNMSLTADFPYYLREALEDGVPGRFEGVGGTAIYVQGTCGGLIGPGAVEPLDASGIPITDKHSFEAAEALGHTYAEFALAALDDTSVAVDDTAPELSFRTRETFVRVDNFNYQAAYRLGILSRELYNFDKDGYIDENNTPDMVTQLVYLQLGPSSMVTVPGEMAPEVFMGCYDGSCAGGWDFISDNNDNPPDVSQAPSGPYLRDVLAEDGSVFQWVIGLGQDEVGYILPNYDYQLDPVSPYVSQPDGDHYEETNSLGPQARDQIVGPLEELIRGE